MVLLTRVHKVLSDFANVVVLAGVLLDLWAQVVLALSVACQLQLGWISEHLKVTLFCLVSAMSVLLGFAALSASFVPSPQASVPWKG
jgi:hypothetical protein